MWLHFVLSIEGTVMILRESEPRARKDHRCNYCGRVIPKGEQHMYSVGFVYGDFNYYRAHYNCYVMASEQEED